VEARVLPQGPLHATGHPIPAGTKEGAASGTTANCRHPPHVWLVALSSHAAAWLELSSHHPGQTEHATMRLLWHLLYVWAG
jgi:hypothetical protein